MSFWDAGSGSSSFELYMKSLGPIMYWRLGEGEETAVDEMEFLDGTYIGSTSSSASLVPTQSDGSTDFSAGAVYVDLLNAVLASGVDSEIASLGESGGSWTVLFWFKDSGDSVTGAAAPHWAVRRTAIEMRHIGTTSIHVPFSIGVDEGKLALGWADNWLTGATRLRSATSVNDGNLHFGAIVNDGNTSIKIYIDGDLDATHAVADAERSVGFIPSLNVNFQIGIRSQDAGGRTLNAWEDKLDEILVFNTALTGPQIELGYNYAIGL